MALLLTEPRGRSRSPAAAAGRDGAVEVEVGEGETEDGVASYNSTSSLILVAWPSLVDMVKVADLPDFLKDWTMTMKDRDSDIKSDLVTK